MTEKIRAGVGTAPEFPPTPVLLSKKTYHRCNILVGNDPVQTRFAEGLLGVTAKNVTIVRDEDCIVSEPVLYQVVTSKAIDLSPQLRLKTGIWSLSPITKGSVSASAIVRAAAEMMDVKLERAKVNRASDLLTADDVGDVRAAFWRAVWIVSAPIPDEEPFWEDPWSGKNWLPPGVDPQYRLNALYRELVGYVLVKDDGEEQARKWGISPSKIKRLKLLKLDYDKTYDSLLELSRWRKDKYEPYICALKIARIWKSEYSSK